MTPVVDDGARTAPHGDPLLAPDVAAALTVGTPLAVPRGVCSPVHHCFPPMPTVCAICGATDGSVCRMGLR